MEELAKKIGAVLAALLGLGGYVLLVGGIVVGVRLEEVGLSSEAGITATPHDELFIYGIETIAAWLGLIVLAAIAYFVIQEMPGEINWWVPLLSALAASGGTFALVLAIDDGNDWYVVGAVVGLAIWVVVVVAWGALTNWKQAAKPLIVGLIGALLALAVSLLYQNQTWSGFAAMFVVAASLVLVGMVLDRRRQHKRHTHSKHGWAAEALIRLPSSTVAVGVIVYAAVVVGAAAVVVQVDRQRFFNHARITLENGKCIEGSYVTRNDTHVVIAGQIATPLGEQPDEKPSLISIRDDETAELQVRGARHDLGAVTRDPACGRAFTKPTAGESAKAP